MLIRRDGLIIFADNVEPLTVNASDWSGAIAEGRPAGWTVTPSDQIRAFASVSLPEELWGHELKAPKWLFVLGLPQAEAMRTVYRLVLAVLGIGLGIIFGLFLIGYWLIDRSIIRRIRQLEKATRRVGLGDLAHRIELAPERGRLLGADEIDALAEDFNRMVQRVEHSHAALQEANELKASFIQVAGHELRTPVSYILATARLLADCKDPDRLGEALGGMGDKAERLNGIIRAMFKLMPDQRYHEHVSYDEVDVSEVVAEAFEDCRPFVERRGQRLIVKKKGRDLPTIQADRDKLLDIVDNLVMNAIKFTPDGGEIRVELGRQLGGVSIAVIDQGPGVSDEDLPHIFDAFYGTADVMKHSSGPSGYQKRGMGLGLTIVRHFAEFHGGTVHVSSGKSGSTFTVTLPSEPPAHASRPGSPQ